MRHRRTTRSLRELHADTRGAMMVWGLFATLLCAGAVLYVHGIGIQLQARERLQDAADAAAFAGAAVHAHGMNLLALCNLVMAALMAVLIALKATEQLAAIGMYTAMAMSFLQPAAVAAVPVFRTVKGVAGQAHRSAEPQVQSGLRAMHAVAQGVATTIPGLSALRAAEAAAQFGPEVQLGIAAPSEFALPVEDAPKDELCRRGGEMAVELAALPFTLSPLGSVAAPVVDTMGGVISSLAGSSWLCDGGGAPSTELHIDRAYPRLDVLVACEEGPLDEAEAACAEASAFAAAAAPDPDTGECQTRCGAGGPYAQVTAEALAACDPQPRLGDSISGVRWQQREVTQRYVSDGRAYRHAGTTVIEGPKLMAGKRPPCTGYADSHPGTEVLCSTEPHPRGRAAGGTERFVTEIEVLRVFGCTRPSTQRYDVEEDDPQLARARNEALEKNLPQRLRTGLQLGDPAFQVRGLALGAKRRDLAEGMLRVLGAPPRASATPEEGREPPAAEDVPPHPADLAGRLGLAQAEYFFEGSAGTGDMLWHPGWRARLRVLRAPWSDAPKEGGTSGDLATICDATDGADAGVCGALAGLLTDLDALVAH